MSQSKNARLEALLRQRAQERRDKPTAGHVRLWSFWSGIERVTPRELVALSMDADPTNLPSFSHTPAREAFEREFRQRERILEDLAGKDNDLQLGDDGKFDLKRAARWFKTFRAVPPEMEALAGLSSDTPVENQSVSASAIIAVFKVRADERDNRKWWDQRMRDAKRYPRLLKCRVATGRGTTASRWNPVQIAAWLIDTAPARRAKIAEQLRNGFPGNDDAADILSRS